MKKTAAIISLYGNSNYGNKLQNYAVQEVLRREGIDSVNIINVPCLNNKNRDISAVLKFYLKGIVQSIIKGDRIKDCVDPNDPKQRKENFLRFNEQIVNSKHFFSFNRLSEFKDYDYYSVPLIPNSLMWWIMSAGDKYIINYFLGDGANGLYSLSSKVPQIINMIYSLFIQAWQMSAIEVSESKDKTSFYHNVFHVTSFVMGVVTCGIIMVVKPLYLGIMSASFAEAWKYVPLLSVATIISCYASYFSVVYTVGAKTKKVFLTTALGAVVNLGANLILVQPFGMQGIAMGTCLGYIAVLIVRVRDMWVEMGIRFDFKRNILTFIVLFIQSAVVIYFGGVLSVVISCAGILFIALLYRKEMVTIINKLIKKQ